MTAAQRDLSAMLARAQADLRAAEERVGQLEGKRREALLEPGHTPAARIDHDLGNERGTIAILRDKIAALNTELSERRLAQRERDKAAAIKALEARLAKKDEAARELERAIGEFSRCFTNYRAAASAAFDGWPHDLFGDPAIFAQSDGVARQVAGGLGIASAAPDIRIAEASARCGPIAADVAAASETILAALKASPLPIEGVLEEAA